MELTRIYLVNHFSQLLTNDTFWSNHELTEPFSEQERKLLQETATAHTPPSPKMVEEAERVVLPRINEQARLEHSALGWIFIGSALCSTAVFALVELFGCCVFRQSPILRLFGIALVNCEGQPAKRWRLLSRWALVWVPTSAIGFLGAGAAALALAARSSVLELDPAFNRPFSTLAWALITGVGAAWFGAVVYAILRPQRSLADRLAGTELVPR